MAVAPASRIKVVCAAMPIGTIGKVEPDWLHLLPAGRVQTFDGAAQLQINSMALLASALRPGETLPIDENCAPDKAALFGQTAPARGWITALQARGDGLWGKVAWTPEGQKLVCDKAYAWVGAVLAVDRSGIIIGLVGACLTNLRSLGGNVAAQSMAGAVGSRVPAKSPVAAPAFDEADRKMMDVFGMSEADYAKALAAERAKSAEDAWVGSTAH